MELFCRKEFIPTDAYNELLQRNQELCIERAISLEHIANLRWVLHVYLLMSFIENCIEDK